MMERSAALYIAQLNLHTSSSCVFVQAQLVQHSSDFHINFLQVTLSEAICFPMLYILYVAIVVFFTFFSVSSPPIDHNIYDYVFFPSEMDCQKERR